MAKSNYQQWWGLVQAGRAFGAESFVIPANSARLQLFNPVGSGVDIWVRSAQLQGGTGGINLLIESAPLATLFGVFTPENMDTGNPAAPLAELRFEDVVGPVPIAGVFVFLTAPGQAMGYWPAPGVEWGCILAPGTGLTAQRGSATLIIMNWLWAEVPE